jgi:hypothetical protein
MTQKLKGVVRVAGGGGGGVAGRVVDGNPVTLDHEGHHCGPPIPNRWLEADCDPVTTLSRLHNQALHEQRIHVEWLYHAARAILLPRARAAAM